MSENSTPLSVNEVMDRIRKYREQDQRPNVFTDIARKIIHRVETFREIDHTLSPIQSENFRASLLGLLIQEVTDEQFETNIDCAYKIATTPTI